MATIGLADNIDQQAVAAVVASLPGTQSGGAFGLGTSRTAAALVATPAP